MNTQWPNRPGFEASPRPQGLLFPVKVKRCRGSVHERAVYRFQRRELLKVFRFHVCPFKAVDMKTILLLLIALHLAAIWFYRRFKKQALTQAMVLGDQVLSGSPPPSRDDAYSRLLALLLFCLCAALVFVLSQQAP